jgi:hypothetical protein
MCPGAIELSHCLVNLHSKERHHQIFRGNLDITFVFLDELPLATSALALYASSLARLFNKDWKNSSRLTYSYPYV